MEHNGAGRMADFPKLLKGWSGRRGSNPRRPAWEVNSNLITQELRVDGDGPWQVRL